jgi:hypothetical protein
MLSLGKNNCRWTAEIIVVDQSGGFHLLVVVFPGAPHFIPRLFAAHPNAEAVRTRRFIGRVLAKLKGAFFRRARRQVSRQFRVALAVGGQQRLSLGQRLLRVAEGGQVLVDQRIEVAGRGGLGAAGFLAGSALGGAGVAGFWAMGVYSFYSM